MDGPMDRLWLMCVFQHHDKLCPLPHNVLQSLTMQWWIQDLTDCEGRANLLLGNIFEKVIIWIESEPSAPPHWIRHCYEPTKRSHTRKRSVLQETLSYT